MRLSTAVGSVVTASLLATASGLAGGGQAIRPRALRAHMAYLADDLLEGRGTGTRGYDLAAAYVAAQLESYGLSPAGGNGSWFQPVPLRDIAAAEGSTLVVEGGERLELVAEKDYLVTPSAVAQGAEAAGPLVFLGYGVTAPERGHDDYAGVDARGRIVVILTGAPRSFPSAVRAHYGNGLEKARNAAAHGAVGVLGVQTKADAARFPWDRIVTHAKTPRMRALHPDGTPLEVVPEIKAAAGLSHDASKRLFAAAGRDLDKDAAEAEAGRLHAVELPLRATIRSRSRHSTTTSPNVVGLLPGSDPRLKDEYFVYSTHLDHLGIGAAVDGDAIYNGAVDNASGVAALLEIARAWSELKTRPKRSVIFLFVTAEEKGLLGSAYFAHHPTVPLARIVANLNVDCPAMLYPLRDIVALGAESSSLGKVARSVARELGLVASPDPMPEEAFFVRSDQYSFVKQGIPALYVGGGLMSTDPRVDGAKVYREWTRSIYHTPRDDLKQPIDLQAGARLAEAQLRIGLAVADVRERPTWNPGDFFGEKFGAARAARPYSSRSATVGSTRAARSAGR